MQVRGFAGVALLASVACNKQPTPPAPSEPAAAESGANATCDGRVAEFDRVLASATKKCTTDKDCVCFRAGISMRLPCGGIIDDKTNERLETVAKEWSAAGCKNDGVMCAAVVCEPRCNAGACGSRQVVQ